MRIVNPSSVFLFWLCASFALAAPDRPSIAINFGAEISAVTGSAGVLETSIWNNVLSSRGVQQPLIGNFGDEQFQADVTLQWEFPSTQPSRGIVADINNQNDANLITGHLAAPGAITVSGLRETFNEGYDVYVYTFAGDPNANQQYQLDTDEGLMVARASIPAPEFSGRFTEGENYLLFGGLSGDQFIIDGLGTINGIEISSTTQPCFGNDLNGDGVVDVQDVDALTAEIKAGGNSICFDLNNDGSVDQTDCAQWIRDQNICPGDADLDGVFDSTDLVKVFESGEYEDGVPCNSGWGDGDWNCDGEFNSSDLVVAFQAGWYNAGLLPNGEAVMASAVPEPHSLSLFVVAAFCMVRPRRTGLLIFEP